MLTICFGADSRGGTARREILWWKICTEVSRAGLILEKDDGMDQNQKFHRSLTDQRKERLKGRLTTRREILWWKICTEIARESGVSVLSKLLIINNLTQWRGKSHSNSR